MAELARRQALKLYYGLLRAQRTAFCGDAELLRAARQRTREEFTRPIGSDELLSRVSRLGVSPSPSLHLHARGCGRRPRPLSSCSTTLCRPSARLYPITIGSTFDRDWKSTMAM